MAPNELRISRRERGTRLLKSPGSRARSGRLHARVRPQAMSVFHKGQTIALGEMYCLRYCQTSGSGSQENDGGTLLVVTVKQELKAGDQHILVL